MNIQAQTIDISQGTEGLSTWLSETEISSIVSVSVVYNSFLLILYT